MAILTPALTLDEFIARYERQPFELLEEEIVPVSPPVAGPNVITRRVFRALLPFEDAGVGEVFTEAPFVLSDVPNWVRGSRVPDVMFYRSARLSAYRETTPDWADKPYVLVPDLVVEVLSPTDSYSDIVSKVERCIRDGVPLVWVVDPKPRTVVVHALGSAAQTLTAEDMLNGGAVLPGFELRVAGLFG